MNALDIALPYFVARPLLNLLTAAGVAVGVGLVVATAALSGATKASAIQTAGGYQLLIAAKGSPVQAVLSTLFFMEPPTGNIPVALYRDLQADQGIARLVPFNFGDSYRGHFIVGTSRDYLALIEDMIGRPARSEPADRWLDRPFDAVLGWTAARRTGLEPGMQFTAAHGFIDLPPALERAHDLRPYTVVSILERTHTAADRAIFTPLETTWIVHQDEARGGERSKATDQITALLVQGRGYADVLRVVAALAQSMEAQTILPARVITTLLSYLRVGEGIVIGVAWLATGIAAVAVMISMLAAAIERLRQIATLRAIGASRLAVAKALVAEAAIISGLGAVGGIVLGRSAVAVIGAHLERTSGLHLDLQLLAFADLGIAGAAMLLGMVAGSLPAYVACREDVARNLAPVS